MVEKDEDAVAEELERASEEPKYSKYKGKVAKFREKLELHIKKMTAESASVSSKND